MSFEVLQNTPQVAPLLVRLYDTHNLYSLAQEKQSDEACLELTTIMVDLLNIKLSDKESELITDVLFALMKKAHEDLKVALAERLSTMENIPLRMILSLANEDIKVADPILRQSPILHDQDLIYILHAKGISHGRSMAMRRGLSGTLINMLADTKDFQIAVNLSGNDGASLTEQAFRIFADMAKENPEIAKPLLAREDVPQDVAGMLYEYVSAELKNVLHARFGIGAAEVVTALDQITAELRDTAEPHTLEPGDHLVIAAMGLRKRGELKLSGIISNLRRGQWASFIAQFSVFCQLPMDSVKALLKQESGKGLAIACRANDIPKADFVSLYLLSERFRGNVKRVVNHKELSRIMQMFDEIKPEEARNVLKNASH